MIKYTIGKGGGEVKRDTTEGYLDVTDLMNMVSGNGASRWCRSRRSRMPRKRRQSRHLSISTLVKQSRPLISFPRPRLRSSPLSSRSPGVSQSKPSLFSRHPRHFRRLRTMRKSSPVIKTQLLQQTVQKLMLRPRRKSLHLNSHSDR